MARKKKQGKLEKAARKGTEIYGYLRHPEEEVAKKAIITGAKAVDKKLDHRKRSKAAKKGWKTRRKRQRARKG